MVGIDTVTLTLQADAFVILEPSRFTPNALKVLKAESKDMGMNKYFDAKRNPTRQETAKFGYLPYLTLYRALRSGGLVTELRIQFSAPKLILGNNFDELATSDFDRVCQRLLDALAHYQIRVRGGVNGLASAQVAVAHYSKNFVLTNLMTARQAVLELQKCDVNTWRDVSKTDYINNGLGYKTHSKYHELAFYDKLAEHRKSQRGQPTFDKDTQIQLDLFNDPTTRERFDVLRMEVRLGNGKAIKQAFERAKLQTDDISFKAIFSSEVSQAVLKWHLQDLYTRYPKITEAITKGATELFSELYVQNPERRLSTILIAIGLRAINEQAGLREMKDIVGPKGSQALLRQAKRTNHELQYRSETSEVFELLQAQLDRFEPVHLRDFEK
jgi:hypothetical protein